MYLDVPVPPALRGCVLGIAGYDEVSTTPLRRREVPTGSCTLIVAFDGTTPAFLAGMHDVAAHTEFVGRQRGVHRRLERSVLAPDPEVAWAWRELTRSGGRIPVHRLAEGTGWSRRHLLTRFRAQVGLAPTPAGRVLRFRRATQALLPGRGPEREPSEARIADVAAGCGYADHAHLVREFRALAGCTPSEFLAEWEFPDVQDPSSPAP